MIFFIAIRNILKNIKDSLVVIILITLITFLFFIGNIIMGNADKNIRESYIDSLTGDVVLQKDGEVTMNLFGANAPIIDSFFTIPVLPAYNAVMEILIEEKNISGITSQVSGIAYLDLLNVREPVLLCGIDPETYFSLFPGIFLKEGSYLKAGEYGAMITEERAQKIEERSGQRPMIGNPLLFTSGGTMGFKIREVPLVGIFSYQNPGQFMNDIVIIDPQTVRVLNSIQVASNSESDISINSSGTENISMNLLNIDIDDIFGESFASVEDTIVDLSEFDEEFSIEYLQQYLRETGTQNRSVEIGGDWHFIILRLDKGVSSQNFISSLNQKIKPFGLTAVNWRIASGISAILTLALQALFNAGMFLVSIIGIIAIINILLISVFRRVREIGTLRAIGASNIFIRSLIYSENIFISFFGGLTGTLGGWFFIRWINTLELSVSNEMIVSMLNGNLIQFEIIPHIAVISFIVAVILGVASSIYPVEIAVKLEPVTAVRRG